MNEMYMDMQKEDKSKELITLLHILAQVRLFHWQTSSYAQHVAFGEYYEELSDLIDTFVESYQGKYCRINLSSEENHEISLKGYHEETVNLFVDEICKYLTEVLCTTFNEDDTELKNIIDEMLGATDKLAYLLTLK